MESDLSSRNLSIVRELYAAFARGDVAAILPVLSPDVEWVEPDNPFNPAAGSRRGEAGFLEWIRIGKRSEDILALDIEKLLAGNDTVAVVGHMKCLAKPTGRIYESDFVHVVSLRDGKVSRFQEFFDTYAAGEAFRFRDRVEAE
jgi:ketosteroid isomerase-like protein